MSQTVVLEPVPVVTTAALFEQALTLSVADRRELVDLLSGTVEEIDLNDPEYLLAHQCLVEYQQHPDDVYDFDEVLDELRAMVP